MSEYYLAVDIGASGGRHMLGTIRDGKLVLEEIYRFGNGMVNQDGKLLWDTGRLFREIINGMKRCKERNKIPVSMSIDTWAVDYVLLDEKDRILSWKDCGENREIRLQERRRHAERFVRITNSVFSYVGSYAKIKEIDGYNFR